MDYKVYVKILKVTGVRNTNSKDSNLRKGFFLGGGVFFFVNHEKIFFHGNNFSYNLLKS